MNTGQSMLAIGAMMLLSTIVLRVNNNFLQTNEVMLESKFGVLATSLAQSIIEEASNKAFDAQTDGSAVHDSTLLTPIGGLGPAGSEIYPNFNDFDDYNNFRDTITHLPSANFYIHCTVNYVTATNPNGISSDITWNKKLTVTVTSPSSKDTIRMSSIFSYWFF